MLSSVACAGVVVGAWEGSSFSVVGVELLSTLAFVPVFDVLGGK